MRHEFAGRLTITWPAGAGAHPLPWHGVTFHDADTGDELVGVVAMRLTNGSVRGWRGGPIGVEITELVDENGERLLGPLCSPVPTPQFLEYKAQHSGEADGFTGARMRTRTSTFLVAEMRLAEPRAIGGPVPPGTAYQVGDGAQSKLFVPLEGG